MTERDATSELPEESGGLPPDYDAPGQVDYPDPAFDDAETDEDIESPDDDEPEPDDDDADDADDDEDEPDD